MLRPFLLVFNQADGSRQDILDYFDTCREVKHWYAVLPAAIFIISDTDAHALSELFRRKYPKRFFIITEVPKGGNNGWLVQKCWDFINHPISSGRWP